MKIINNEKGIIKLIIIAGVLLSTLQFFYNRSLWLDEAYLALNIVNKTHFELLKPLDLMQVAPILFLEIEKLFSDLIPNSEFGLRLFPLISFLLSIFLFYKLIKAIQQNYYSIIFSLSLFVFNTTLIYYSSEVKQYMTDVLVLISVYYLILRKYKHEKYKYYYLGIGGTISIFLSNVTPIILFTTGLYFLHNYYRNDKKYFLNLISISIVWASSFLLYYFLFIYKNPVTDLMMTHWPKLDRMPTNPLNLECYKFLFQKCYMIFIYLFQFGKAVGFIIFILTLLGIVSFVRKRRIDFIILTMTPIVSHLLLSSVKLYPFDKRFILYACPIIIIICSFGFNYLVDILFADLKIEKSKLLPISIPLLMFFCFCMNGFPLQRSEIKKSIKFIEQHMDEKDKVYVNYYARIPFQYYDEISFLKMDTNNIFIGNKYINDNINYSYEVSLFSGRVWFLFTTYIRNDLKNMEFLINYFDSKNEGIIQEFHVKGSDVYLYDFSN